MTIDSTNWCPYRVGGSGRPVELFVSGPRSPRCWPIDSFVSGPRYCWIGVWCLFGTKCRCYVGTIHVRWVIDRLHASRVSTGCGYQHYSPGR